MLSRFSLLQKAFRQNDLTLTKRAHSKQAIEAALDHPDDHQLSGKYLGDAVYGALDGLVTTFAVVTAVVGSNLSINVILILGFANLFGDGFSMSVGRYLSLKSEQDYAKEELNRERWEIENYPEGEIEEIRQIYKQKGFEGKDLERAVEIITADRDRWIKAMMVDELGIIPENESPMKASLVTFVAFVVCGFLPLLTFVLISFFPGLMPKAFLLSCLITAVSAFAVGSLRSLLIAKSWIIAGLEMLVLTAAASGVAYGIGALLSGIA